MDELSHRHEELYAKLIDRLCGPSQQCCSLYHYTDIHALCSGIITNTGINLRATHFTCLNDPVELMRGKEFVQDFYSRLSGKELPLRIYKNNYLISFTENSDDLSMWTMYGRSNGVAIEIKRESLKYDDGYRIYKCMYDETEVENALEWYAKKSILLEKNEKGKDWWYMNFLVFLGNIPFLLKGEAYKNEREVRLIGNMGKREIEFREKNGLIIPYKTISFPKEALLSVTLSPAYSQDIREERLRFFLDTLGYNDVDIKKSRIAFRNL